MISSRWRRGKAAACACHHGFVAGPCAAPAAPGPPPLPEVAKLSDKVIRVLGRNPSPFALTGTNLYLVGTGVSRILIDAGEGKPGVLEDLLRTMSAEGCRELSQLVITHWHYDHLLGVPEILRHFGDELPVRKYMPVQGTASGELENVEGAWSPLEFLSNIAIQELVDGETLTCEGATLTVLHTPGHANDHVCLFLEEEKALFTGDNVLGWGTGTFQDLQQYMRSLKLMAAQAPGVLYPAHGPVISGASEVSAWLQMYITHREERIQQVEDELQSAGSGLDLVDLVRRVYQAQPHVLESEGLFRGACLNTKRVLDFLSHAGRLRQEGRMYVWTPGASRL
mmetsp:Transcript_52748/g.98764  ORF Transcript_52748/g.98764 Transcript_52748/m.98764 type:complete len:339 (+) Transcript_52748:34-1050(+)